MNTNIINVFDLQRPAVVSVVGCGGKSSFIELVAESLAAEKKVLISPTTKMFPLNVRGVDCRGEFNSKTGKLEALPMAELAELVSQYDIMLLEADGSRGLPCKGWLDYEPVVPEFSTHTIGVIDINAVGKYATAENVHNLPQFLELTGLCENDKITIDALKNMICAPRGMFKNSVGINMLFVNHVESITATETAEQLLLKIKEEYPYLLSKLLYGSVNNEASFFEYYTVHIV
jgi:probable selenium-dependent hydroxylase accessory protein YqeC